MTPTELKKRRRLPLPATPSMPFWHLNDYTAPELADIGARISDLVATCPSYPLHCCRDNEVRCRISQEIRDALFTIEEQVAQPLLPNPFLDEDQLRAFELWVGAKS